MDSEGMLELYPGNPILGKLWNNIPRGNAPKADVTSLLWWRPSEGKPQDFSEVPTAEAFPLQGYVVMKSGHGKDDLMMTLCDPGFPGHTHPEAGSITLYAFGTRFITDLGQGCGEAQYHSQPLGQRSRPRLHLQDPIPTSDRLGRPRQLGSIATADLKEPFASRADNHLDYTVPSPWTPLLQGSRRLALVNNPKDKVPPYYLIYDDIDADGKINTYSQLFHQRAWTSRSSLATTSSQSAPHYDGSWLKPLPDKTGKVVFSFDAKTKQTCQVWLYTRSPSKQHRIALDGKQQTGFVSLTPPPERAAGSGCR